MIIAMMLLSRESLILLDFVYNDHLRLLKEIKTRIVLCTMK